MTEDMHDQLNFGIMKLSIDIEGFKSRVAHALMTQHDTFSKEISEALTNLDLQKMVREAVCRQAARAIEEVVRYSINEMVYEAKPVLLEAAAKCFSMSVNKQMKREKEARKS